MFNLAEPFLITPTSHPFSAYIRCYNGDHELKDVHSIDVPRGRAFTLIKKDGKVLYHRKQVLTRRGEDEVEPVVNEVGCDRIKLHPDADEKARFHFSEFISKLPKPCPVNCEYGSKPRK